jgi:hypothetical protein
VEEPGEVTDRAESGSGLIGASGYQELGVGARVWGVPAKGFDLYYDDIALGTARLGPVK